MVMGIMGHTQGVSRATRPPRNPRPRMAHQGDWAVSGEAAEASATTSTGAQRSLSVWREGAAEGASAFSAGSCSGWATGAGFPKVRSKFSRVGGVQALSVQAMYSTVPRITAPLAPSVSLKRWMNDTLPSHMGRLSLRLWSNIVLAGTEGSTSPTSSRPGVGSMVNTVSWGATASGPRGGISSP